MSLKANEFSVGGVSEPSFQAIVPGTGQSVAIGGSSVRSTALQASTSLVRLKTTTDCFLAFGASTPTAVANGTCVFLASGETEYFGVSPGSKIAVIQSSASGTLYITEGA